MLLYGSGLRVDAGPAAGWGVGLLVALRGLGGAVDHLVGGPDAELARSQPRAGVRARGGLGIVLGSSVPRAAERVALALLAVATVVAAYALGGKLFPWLHVGGVIDLNHTDRFSRLRAPLDYWNALGLVCVVGGADRHARGRRAALPLRAAGGRRRCRWSCC